MVNSEGDCLLIQLDLQVVVKPLKLQQGPAMHPNCWKLPATTQTENALLQQQHM